MKQRGASPPCPCGGTQYASCCARWHCGQDAPTAGQLMRSRYSAYALGLHDYLAATWHVRTRPPLAEWRDDSGTRWLGLEVRSEQEHGDNATVEFVARYNTGGRAHRLHEVSRIVREGGRWYYLDGTFPESQA